MAELQVYIFRIHTPKGWEKVRVVDSPYGIHNALVKANRAFKGVDHLQTQLLQSYPYQPQECAR